MKYSLFLLILMFAFSVPVSAKDSLYFKYNMFKGPSYEIKIANGKGIILYYRGGLELSDPTSEWCDGEFSDIELDAVLLMLKKEGIFKWEQIYREPFVRDGESYRLALVSGEETSHSRGFNKFSENFKTLEEILAVVEKNLGCSGRITP